MWKRGNVGSRVRPWIAIVAAYALALQLLMIGVVAGHAMNAGDASGSGLFVICHADSSSNDQGLPDTEPTARPPCIFCTLAKAPCAILPSGDGIAISDAIGILKTVAGADGRHIAFHSPTGQYQRGPPMSISIFG